MATSTPLRATRRLAPDASRTRSLLRRWGLALRFVAICLAAMLMLAALQGASCALSAAQRYCVEVPISMFYALHAAAIAFSLWAVLGAVAELIRARRHRSGHASRPALHR
jgi:hypothetical protein